MKKRRPVIQEKVYTTDPARVAKLLLRIMDYPLTGDQSSQYEMPEEVRGRVGR
jgi:hypothetical protein